MRLPWSAKAVADRGVEGGGVSSPMARRQRLVVRASVACAVLSLAGLAASTIIKSPEQLASESRAPVASVITAPVQERILKQTVVVRGTVAAATTLDVTPVIGVDGATKQIVTSVRAKVGKSVSPGDVLLEVSGRPLIALKGQIPPYRDLKPGMKGQDVSQLQQALRGLGHYHGGDAAGTYASSTKAAVLRFYDDLGYNAPMTDGVGGATDRAALDNAQEAVEQARRQVDLLKSQLDGGLVQERAGAESLPTQLKYLQRSLDKAERTYADLAARTGAVVPMGEVVFLPRFPALVAKSSATVGGLVKEPLISLSTGALGVVAKLRPDQAETVTKGMTAQIVAEAFGSEMAGTVEGVAPVQTDSERVGVGSPEGTGTAAPYAPLTISPSSALPTSWAGTDVRVEVTAAQSPGAVEVVPLAAVSTGTDGRTVVSKVDSTGGQIIVEVRPGMSADGFVEVTATAGQLGPGDEVVVGR
ncbi:peptidoglycan-binding protein [Micromonospora sp. NPDC048986]|uniref:peptidoglycan-binding protein n=1 Tax=Micromonospora sp. NPDC048986 TaxID=3155644 RepID=UPI0033E6CC0F